MDQLAYQIDGALAADDAPLGELVQRAQDGDHAVGLNLSLHQPWECAACAAHR